MSNRPRPSRAPEPQRPEVHDETAGAAALPPAERISRLVAQQTTFAGPIPHPEIFRKYGEVVPTVLAILNQPWVAGVIAGTTLIGVLSAYLGRNGPSTNKE